MMRNMLRVMVVLALSSLALGAALAHEEDPTCKDVCREDRNGNIDKPWKVAILTTPKCKWSRCRGCAECETCTLPDTKANLAVVALICKRPRPSHRVHPPFPRHIPANSPRTPTPHSPPHVHNSLTIPYRTFFAPTNAAFDHVPFYDSIDAHYDFTQTLKHHLVEGVFTFAELKKRSLAATDNEPATLPTLACTTLTIYYDCKKETIIINWEDIGDNLHPHGVVSATIENADMNANNGIIHVIDAVLGSPDEH